MIFTFSATGNSYHVSRLVSEASFGIEKTVTVHIRNIREKIEINPKEPKYLKVVYGLGYKIEKL